MKRGTPYAINNLLSELRVLEGPGGRKDPYYTEARKLAIADLKRALKKLGYTDEVTTKDGPGGSGGGPGSEGGGG